MAAQKRKKKNICKKFLAFLNVYYAKTHLIKALLILQDQMEHYHKIQKREAFGDTSKTCSVVNFPEKYTDFGGLETNRRHEIQT